jgi:hypothetical protein
VQDLSHAGVWSRTLAAVTIALGAIALRLG